MIDNMIKRKDLVKVIIKKDVYYKYSEIQKCEEIREEYSVRAIKEILAPYAVRLSGMGNSKWIKEGGTPHQHLRQHLWPQPCADDRRRDSPQD